MKKYLLIFLLLFPLHAHAFVFQNGGAKSASQFLAMPSTNLQALYSVLRQTGWTGSCMRVHRTSDHTEEDIGFVNNVCDIATAMAFASPGTPKVATWYDQSGNGCDATQATEGSMPSFSSFNMINNIPGVTFGQLTIPSCLTTSTQSETVFAVHAPMALSGGLFELNSTYTGGNSLTMGAFIFPDGLLNSSSFGSTGLYSNMQPEVSVMTSSASSRTYNLNNSLATGIATTASATTTGGIIHNISSNHVYLGQTYLLGVYSDVKDQSSVISPTINNLYSLFDITPAATSRITFDGDSITEGTGATLTVNNEFQVAPLLTKSAQIRNIGQFGQTLATMLSQENSAIVSAKLTGVNNVVLTAGGEADICNSGTDEATVFSDLESYVSTAKTAGFTVLVGTLIYDNASGCGNGTAKDTARQTYNADVISHASADGYTVVDYDSIPQLQYPQTAGYSADGTHPTTAGYALMAQVAATALNSILP